MKIDFIDLQPRIDDLISRLSWSIVHEKRSIPNSSLETIRSLEGAILLLTELKSIAVPIQECVDAVEFFDKVKVATSDEKIAVGHDHWDRLEAAVRAIRELSR